MLSPGLHDSGNIVRLTQSAAQRFTLTNLLPHAIRIASPPTLSSNIAVPSVNQGSANVGFSSPVDPNLRFASMTLDASTFTVSAVGEAVFQNGFEFGVAQCLE